jgi:hypothetical protein
LFVIGVVPAAHLVITIINGLQGFRGFDDDISQQQIGFIVRATSYVLDVPVSQLAPVVRGNKDDLPSKSRGWPIVTAIPSNDAMARSLNTSSGVRRTMTFLCHLGQAQAALWRHTPAHQSLRSGRP